MTTVSCDGAPPRMWVSAGMGRLNMSDKKGKVFPREFSIAPQNCLHVLELAHQVSKKCTLEFTVDTQDDRVTMIHYPCVPKGN